MFSKSLLFLVQCYQVAASPILGGACRFEPSCSCYALEAIKTHSPSRAIYLIIKRLLKCRPGGPSGHDPVPSTCIACGGSYGAESK